MYNIYGAVLATLEAMIDGNDQTNAIKAEGILHQIKSFKLLVTLILFWCILSCTKSLSNQLQTTQINLTKACELVCATLETLQQFSNDEEWDKHY